ncbi:hypothetical protein BgiMline_004478 [Biomphalaria glabrata]
MENTRVQFYFYLEADVTFGDFPQFTQDGFIQLKQTQLRFRTSVPSRETLTSVFTHIKTAAMGHRLPAAGIPTKLSEHFQFYRVTPPEVQCKTTRGREHFNSCTLRPKFLARIVLRQVCQCENQCCADKERLLVCCKRMNPSPYLEQDCYVESPRDVRCLDIEPGSGRPNFCQEQKWKRRRTAGNVCRKVDKRMNFIGKIEECYPELVKEL